MDSEGDLGEPHGLVSTALAQRGTVGPEVNRRWLPGFGWAHAEVQWKHHKEALHVLEDRIKTL